MTFNYSPSGDDSEMKVYVNCHCKYRNEVGKIISRMRFPVFSVKDDDGSVTYSLEQLTGSYEPEKFEAGCDFEVTMARINYGKLDDNYGEGGHIVAKQVRTVTFKYIPEEN